GSPAHARRHSPAAPSCPPPPRRPAPAPGSRPPGPHRTAGPASPARRAGPSAPQRVPGHGKVSPSHRHRPAPPADWHRRLAIWRMRARPTGVSLFITTHGVSFKRAAGPRRQGGRYAQPGGTQPYARAWTACARLTRHAEDPMTRNVIWQDHVPALQPVDETVDHVRGLPAGRLILE